jgi:hypothetical protein
MKVERLQELCETTALDNEVVKSRAILHHSRMSTRSADHELHVRAWKDKPFGVFVDWNPDVSCAGHAPGN